MASNIACNAKPYDVDEDSILILSTKYYVTDSVPLACLYHNRSLERFACPPNAEVRSLGVRHRTVTPSGPATWKRRTGENSSSASQSGPCARHQQSWYHPSSTTRRSTHCCRSTSGICTRRTGKLYKALFRMYRSQIFQVNARWKALAEIYTMHSFAPFSYLNFFVKNRQNVFAIE